MKDKEIVARMVDEVMCVGMDNTKEVDVRATLYRKAGLELLVLAAQMEAEILFAE